MSNFSAPTRLKGSDDEYRDAVWVDNYFPAADSRAGRYGVRFRGKIDFLPGDKFEIKIGGEE